ncbi:hypothetical protein [Micromonospora purpureochromogenes]|uniref:Type II secretory pathway pseudopilin PulG n=1 Tax=Micromonospora purpureochromogenes TaxID=47872 RepID=A0ABX2RE95_9ACTN|nr:hypothetical protein [Micromonospora purpureochromogenes]NYF54797.1 type II secretory pathway pseudopilin PulG [Micromonospora purpureochromogenes]
MSSGTPAWVVLAVAALGVLGTLAAAVITQVLSGRREARQWERQRAHERERWERERAERQEQWQREDHARWHQERHAAYAELLHRIEEWDFDVFQAIPSTGPGPATLTEEEKTKVTVALAEVAQADDKARLFASDDTDEAARGFYMDAVFCLSRLTAGGLDDPESLKQMRFDLRALQDKKSKLFALIRRDLGIGAGYTEPEWQRSGAPAGQVDA